MLALAAFHLVHSLASFRSQPKHLLFWEHNFGHFIYSHVQCHPHTWFISLEACASAVTICLLTCVVLVLPHFNRGFREQETISPVPGRVSGLIHIAWLSEWRRMNELRGFKWLILSPVVVLNIWTPVFWVQVHRLFQSNWPFLLSLSSRMLKPMRWEEPGTWGLGAHLLGYVEE